MAILAVASAASAGTHSGSADRSRCTNPSSLGRRVPPGLPPVPGASAPPGPPRSPRPPRGGRGGAAARGGARGGGGGGGGRGGWGAGGRGGGAPPAGGGGGPPPMRLRGPAHLDRVRRLPIRAVTSLLGLDDLA